ncbi:Uncharacterised protein [Moraxella lacunata]|uniref:Uncharacterized protein n=1 Tax=Moraxella lacunata TaxID=477 RepID=A0A378QFJ2_MORLA|nr:hypothetical protein [Moraxella lacunata]STY99666.1 Uncharacterised protein [Moraxella lacunata]
MSEQPTIDNQEQTSKSPIYLILTDKKRFIDIGRVFWMVDMIEEYPCCEYRLISHTEYQLFTSTQNKDRQLKLYHSLFGVIISSNQSLSTKSSAIASAC